MKLIIRTAEARAADALAAARARAVVRLRAALAAAADDDAPQHEREVWASKAVAARGVAAGKADGTIAVEAALTGETPRALALRVVARADARAALIARLTGIRRAAEARFAAARDEDGVAVALSAALEAVAGAGER